MVEKDIGVIRESNHTVGIFKALASLARSGPKRAHRRGFRFDVRSKSRVDSSYVQAPRRAAGIRAKSAVGRRAISLFASYFDFVARAILAVIGAAGLPARPPLLANLNRSGSAAERGRGRGQQGRTRTAGARSAASRKK